MKGTVLIVRPEQLQLAKEFAGNIDVYITRLVIIRTLLYTYSILRRTGAALICMHKHIWMASGDNLAVITSNEDYCRRQLKLACLNRYYGSV